MDDDTFHIMTEEKRQRETLKINTSKLKRNTFRRTERHEADGEHRQTGTLVAENRSRVAIANLLFRSRSDAEIWNRRKNFKVQENE